MADQWTDREWALAERLSVPCAVGCLKALDIVHRLPDWSVCISCLGTGNVYPLREPCPNRHAGQMCRRGLDSCCGKGYTPKCDYDSLCTAIRQRGDWSCRVFIAEDVNDDFVEIRVVPSWEILGLVDADDDPRLFGGAAIHEALLRALEKEVTDAKH